MLDGTLLYKINYARNRIRTASRCLGNGVDGDLKRVDRAPCVLIVFGRVDFAQREPRKVVLSVVRPQLTDMLPDVQLRHCRVICRRRVGIGIGMV